MDQSNENIEKELKNIVNSKEIEIIFEKNKN